MGQSGGKFGTVLDDLTGRQVIYMGVVSPSEPSVHVGDVTQGVRNKWPVLDDGCMVRLAGIKHPMGVLIQDCLQEDAISVVVFQPTGFSLFYHLGSGLNPAT